MQNLISLSDSFLNGITQQTVDGRELHAFLENGDRFTTWISDRIEQFGFVENIDFVSFLENPEKPSGGRPHKVYALSLSMAKELSMVERNEKGKQARLYFIECEARAKQNLVDPTKLSKADWIKMALEYEQQREALEKKAVGLDNQIERDAPLVSFALGVSDYGDAVLIDIAAKNVDIKPKQYRQRIKELGWLRHDGHPMQFTIDRGYMKVKTKKITHYSGQTEYKYTPLITGKGQVKVAKLSGYQFAQQDNLFDDR